jgi:crossover junction endodeoxyribonuclease RusA
MPTTDTIARGTAEAELRLTLPWPSPSLSPNARVHWRQKAAAAKTNRHAAWAITREAVGPSKPGWIGAQLSVTFCPPDRRRIDTDNCIARAKSSFDGIADALGVDDSRFVSTYCIGEPVKGGAVFVTVRPM